MRPDGMSAQAIAGSPGSGVMSANGFGKRSMSSKKPLQQQQQQAQQANGMPRKAAPQGGGGGAGGEVSGVINGGVVTNGMNGGVNGSSGAGGGAIKKVVDTAIRGRDRKLTGERTVKALRLSKALTIPDVTMVTDACRRMAQRRVDAALLTDSNALLCGIITDKDIAMRVVAEGLNPEAIPVSKVMTRNPIFCLSDMSAVEALQKMVQGKFRHLPVVENGEVIALLDITKCLFDAIARMERAAEKGNAIAAAVEGVERQWGPSLGASLSFIENLRDKMFRPTLSTLVGENRKLAIATPSDTVFTAARRMRDMKVSAVVVTTGTKPQGILTAKDVLMKVVAQGLSPGVTIEKVMTPNPECGFLDTTIVDALHTMHDGRFLHLPVVERDGTLVTCVDVLHLTHWAVAQVGTTNQADTNAMMQRFWDSAFSLDPPEEDEDALSCHGSDFSGRACDVETSSRVGSQAPMLVGNGFTFKIEDKTGRMHRFTCGIENLDELLMAVSSRMGLDMKGTNAPHIMYEDDEGDMVLLNNDSDLIAAVNLARASGWKGIRLYLDVDKSPSSLRRLQSRRKSATDPWAVSTRAMFVTSVACLGVGLMLYMKKTNPQMSSEELKAVVSTVAGKRS